MYTRSLLYWSLLAPVAFIVGFLVEGATRPGYSAWRHAVSQLSVALIAGLGWGIRLTARLLADPAHNPIDRTTAVDQAAVRQSAAGQQ